MEKKKIIEWLGSILRRDDIRLSEIPVPSEETVENLIRKAASAGIDKNPEEKNQEENTIPSSTPEKEQPDPAEDRGENLAKESCPYILKRNIVTSLQEIRRFAEEHNLASAMIKALLTLLAEMAVNALKGKVSASALAVLLNAMNFDKARTEAYKEGEIAGRNAQIMEKHFPTVDDGLPHLPSTPKKGSDKESIFSIAKESR